MLKRFLARENIVVGIVGGVVCLAIGLFFMWRDSYMEDHGASALIIGASFAALFIACGVLGDWLERRREQGPPSGFDVQKKEAEEKPKDSGRL